MSSQDEVKTTTGSCCSKTVNDLVCGRTIERHIHVSFTEKNNQQQMTRSEKPILLSHFLLWYDWVRGLGPSAPSLATAMFPLLLNYVLVCR